MSSRGRARMVSVMARAFFLGPFGKGLYTTGDSFQMENLSLRGLSVQLKFIREPRIGMLRMLHYSVDSDSIWFAFDSGFWPLLSRKCGSRFEFQPYC